MRKLTLAAAVGETATDSSPFFSGLPCGLIRYNSTVFFAEGPRQETSALIDKGLFRASTCPESRNGPRDTS